jgi:peptidoglycan/LPS O-acetylase OafA/YrhL
MSEARGTAHQLTPASEVIIKPGGSLKYMPQLDGLRAIAVAMVVVEHYKIIQVGTSLYGVKLFFVLSGFLITAILLGSRDAVQLGVSPGAGHAMRQFMIRRTLRIFPLYYLVVFGSLFLGISEAREYSPWMLTYTLNWKIAEQGWYMNHFAHLWSLAVEEQFYLFWPWIILLIPRKWLLAAVAVMIIAGPLYRLYHVLGWLYFGSEVSGLVVYVSTFSALDSLGMGALLAFAAKAPGGLRATSRRWDVAALMSVGALFTLLVLPATGGASMVPIVVKDTLTAVIFAWVILRAARGVPGPIGRLLSAKPLVFVGTISYGVYVYHQLVAGAAPTVAAWLGVAFPASDLAGSLILIIVTLLVASISAHAFERPINRLKTRFETRTVPPVSIPLGLGVEGATVAAGYGTSSRSDTSG